MVEFAISFPLVVLLAMGATDFAQLFWNAIGVSNGAGVGAWYGARDNIKAGDLAGMQSRALADAANVKGATATASQWCGCGDGNAISSCADILTSTCAGGERPRAYVRVNVTKSFQTMANWPGVPRTTPVGYTAWMRVR